MAKVITFYGASGIGYGFEQIDEKTAWAARTGVAVFAAPDAYGWRVIQVVDLKGRDHDVRLIWAYHDADRFGANSVFFAGSLDQAERKRMIRDLENGVSPVMGCGALALAA